MKNIINLNRPIAQFIFILFFFALLFTGCAPEDDGFDFNGFNNNSNPCETVTCQNGGTCYSGTCDCPPGYSGTYCQNYDPCYNLNCENGGTCNNGSCNCPEGYYGNECQFVRTPIGVRITQIDIIEWPEYNNGYFWDNNSGRPDIYLTIDINGSRVSTSSYHQQCNLNNEYTYSGTGFPVYISTTSNKITVWLWDYDGNAGSENMGGLYFYPDNYQSSLLETRVMSNSSWQIKYKVHFDWVF